MTAAPRVADRAAFEAGVAALRTREKALTHEADAIAAARRRLPMVEVDPATPLAGPDGRPIAQWNRIRAGYSPAP